MNKKGLGICDKLEFSLPEPYIFIPVFHIRELIINVWGEVIEGAERAVDSKLLFTLCSQVLSFSFSKLTG